MMVSSNLDSDGQILKLQWLGKLKEEEDEDPGGVAKRKREVGRDKKCGSLNQGLG